MPYGEDITRVTVSIGAASAQPKVGDAPEPLVEAADQMLYRAKENGRDQVQSGAPDGPAE